MRFPELIFIIITLGLIGFLILSLKAHKRQRNLNKLMLRFLVSTLIISFSYIWFVPIYVGQRRERAVCKFRFQVFKYDAHDYGYGIIKDYFIKLKPSKYGTIVFYDKIGNWKEYFGLKSYEYQTSEAYFGKEKE